MKNSRLMRASAEAFEHLCSSLQVSVDLAKMLTSLKIDEENTSVKAWKRFEELKRGLEVLDGNSILKVIDGFRNLAELIRAAEGANFISDPNIEFPELARLMEASESNETVVDEPDAKTDIETARRYQDDSDEIDEEPEEEEEEPETSEEDELDEIEDDEEESDVDEEAEPSPEFTTHCSALNDTLNRIRAAHDAAAHVEPALGVPEGYKPIDWLVKSGIPRDKYMINRSRAVIDRLKTSDRNPMGVTLRTRRKNGREVYELLGTTRKGGKRKTPRVFVTPDELFDTAFPEFAGMHVSRTGKIDIEAISVPCTINGIVNSTAKTPIAVDNAPSKPAIETTTPEKVITEMFGEEPKKSEDGWVDIDWIEGVSSGRYSVNADGFIRNNLTKEATKGHLNLMGSNPDCTRIFSFDHDIDGQHCITRRVAIIVWQAFHPETRPQKGIRVKHKDGDRKNCELSNLYR